MLPTIWNSITQSLARIIPAVKMNARKTVAKSVVHRRLVVTVERESVSVWMRGPSAGGTERVATLNALLDRGPTANPAPKEEPAATQDANSTPRLGADPRLSKGGG
jgi:hypothetical protein